LLSRDRVIAAPSGALFMTPFFRKLIKFKSLVDGVVIQTIHTFVASR
jgi:hypothetical protein